MEKEGDRKDKAGDDNGKRKAEGGKNGTGDGKVNLRDGKYRTEEGEDKAGDGKDNVEDGVKAVKVNGKAIGPKTGKEKSAEDTDSAKKGQSTEGKSGDGKSADTKADGKSAAGDGKSAVLKSVPKKPPPLAAPELQSRLERKIASMLKVSTRRAGRRLGSLSARAATAQAAAHKALRKRGLASGSPASPSSSSGGSDEASSAMDSEELLGEVFVHMKRNSRAGSLTVATTLARYLQRTQTQRVSRGRVTIRHSTVAPSRRRTSVPGVAPRHHMVEELRLLTEHRLQGASKISALKILRDVGLWEPLEEQRVASILEKRWLLDARSAILKLGAKLKLSVKAFFLALRNVDETPGDAHYLAAASSVALNLLSYSALDALWLKKSTRNLRNSMVQKAIDVASCAILRARHRLYPAGFTHSADFANLLFALALGLETIGRVEVALEVWLCQLRVLNEFLQKCHTGEDDVQGVSKGKQDPPYRWRLPNAQDSLKYRPAPLNSESSSSSTSNSEDNEASSQKSITSSSSGSGDSLRAALSATRKQQIDSFLLLWVEAASSSRFIQDLVYELEVSAERHGGNIARRAESFRVLRPLVEGELCLPWGRILSSAPPDSQPISQYADLVRLRLSLERAAPFRVHEHPLYQLACCNLSPTGAVHASAWYETLNKIPRSLWMPCIKEQIIQLLVRHVLCVSSQNQTILDLFQSSLENYRAIYQLVNVLEVNWRLLRTQVATLTGKLRVQKMNVDQTKLLGRVTEEVKHAASPADFYASVSAYPRVVAKSFLLFGYIDEGPLAFGLGYPETRVFMKPSIYETPEKISYRSAVSVSRRKGHQALDMALMDLWLTNLCRWGFDELQTIKSTVDAFERDPQEMPGIYQTTPFFDFFKKLRPHLNLPFLDILFSAINHWHKPVTDDSSAAEKFSMPMQQHWSKAVSLLASLGLHKC
eukprot:Gregarina_sp_Poly_1__431@NODE_1104_length_5088_cov_16_476200_g765_i0_p1_GENE_NODE_1104_length_5088_cov_16_476200_g765_i0NODE_1104_length_5088_cov_16_476200_g765_i0_p1_ORF_typecomplete_len1074_score211_27_NODE_1104_length_5088_cov_16_476200_g765_i04083224